MNIRFNDPQTARDAIESAIEYLVDEDGYTREQLEEYLYPQVDTMFGVEEVQNGE